MGGDTVGPKRLRLVTLLVAGMAFAAVANADPYPFVRITDNAPVDVANQLSMDVTDEGGGVVGFWFSNACTVVGPSITHVYFDDGVLFGIPSIDSSDGVQFSQGANPGDLPGGNELDPPFETSHGFLADADAPTYHNGVNASDEWLGVFFTLDGGTYATVIDQLDNGMLRVGLHVQGIGPDGEYSDSFVNVPVPGAVLLGAIGLGLVGWIRKRSG